MTHQPFFRVPSMAKKLVTDLRSNAYTDPSQQGLVPPLALHSLASLHRCSGSLEDCSMCTVGASIVINITMVPSS